MIIKIRKDLDGGKYGTNWLLKKMKLLFSL